MAEAFRIKRFLPRGLFGRSLIIIVAPILLLQAIIAYVFFERDLDTTTRRLARDVAADIALLVAVGVRGRWRSATIAVNEGVVPTAPRTTTSRPQPTPAPARTISSRLIRCCLPRTR